MLPRDLEMPEMSNPGSEGLASREFRRLRHWSIEWQWPSILLGRPIATHAFVGRDEFGRFFCAGRVVMARFVSGC